MSQYLLSVHTRSSGEAPVEPNEQATKRETMQEMMGRIIAPEAEARAQSPSAADSPARTGRRSCGGTMAKCS